MMIRRSIPLLFVALFISALSLTPLSFGQEASGRSGSRGKVEIQRAAAYPLEYVAPQHAQEMLEGLLELPVRVVADARTNRLFVVTNDPTHKQISELISMFDVPAPQHPDDISMSRVIQLKNRTIESILPTLETMPGGIVSAISATNSLIAYAPPAELDALEALVRTLDVEAESIELECWILSADSKSKIADDRTLAPLERELAKTGLTGYGTLSHMTVRGLSGEKFRSRQEFRDRRVRETNLSGKVHLSNESGARLSFDLRVLLESTDTEGAATIEGSFSISTELKTEIGKLVVVGLAPTGDEKTKPLVLVMRVGR